MEGAGQGGGRRDIQPRTIESRSAPMLGILLTIIASIVEMEMSEVHVK
jgi:hypothetical protein